MTYTGETRILMELTTFYKVVHILERTLELAMVGIHLSVIPAAGLWRQEVQEFEAILSYTVS